MADVVDIPEFRAFYYTDDTPRQFYTLRRYEDESGSGKMHCYNIAPGIQLSFNDLNLSSCYQPLNVQKDFLEINYCLEGGHEVEMVGGGITFLGEKDLSISGLYHDKRVIVNSRIPFNKYKGITILLELETAQTTLDNEFSKWHIDLQKIRTTLCPEGRVLLIKSKQKIDHIFAEILSVENQIRLPYYWLKILEILQLLLKQTDEHHYATGADILRFWETHGIQTTRKNVYSDIQLLMDFGLDVICIKSTQNRYFVGSRLLELPELKLLVDAVESSHLITEKKSTALIEKLGHLTSRHNAALLNRPVYMDGTAKPDNEAVYYAIDAIQTAIHKQRAISFQYFEYTPKKEKVLKHKGYRYGFSPYVLIWSRDFYYAVGWSEKHGKLAQFRVDRMTAIQDSDAPYIADPSFDPASYIREIFGMYHDMPQRVTLLCENRTMRNIIDHFGEDVDTEVVDANHFRATVDVAPTPPFFSWVFTFGGAIRIEGPGEALAKMRDMASWLHT